MFIFLNDRKLYFQKLLRNLFFCVLAYIMSYAFLTCWFNTHTHFSVAPTTHDFVLVSDSWNLAYIAS